MNEKKVFVGYFSYQISSNALYQLFSQFGEIESIYKSNSVPKTFAFVNFKTKESALNAAKILDGIVWENDQIKVHLAIDKDKDFLENVSAESCSEDESCRNKENGRRNRRAQVKNNKRNRKRSKSKKKSPERCSSAAAENSVKEFENLNRNKSSERINLFDKIVTNTFDSAPADPYLIYPPTLNSPQNLISRSIQASTSNVAQPIPDVKDAPTSKSDDKLKFRYFQQQINPKLDSFKPPSKDKISQKKKSNRPNGQYNPHVYDPYSPLFGRIYKNKEIDQNLRKNDRLLNTESNNNYINQPLFFIDKNPSDSFKLSSRSSEIDRNSYAKDRTKNIPQIDLDCSDNSKVASSFATAPPFASRLHFGSAFSNPISAKATSNSSQINLNDDLDNLDKSVEIITLD